MNAAIVPQVAKIIFAQVADELPRILKEWAQIAHMQQQSLSLF
ncbi:hypothetical protein [Candidatus Igneacidithiobacillus taiwanensis]|nr:hypothetical protein [Candidatus Igneacidithiobacillus taiwanensis]